MSRRSDDIEAALRRAKEWGQGRYLISGTTALMLCLVAGKLTGTLEEPWWVVLSPYLLQVAVSWFFALGLAVAVLSKDAREG